MVDALMEEKKKIKFYVYSSDHPFKHTRFPTYLQYLCGSKGLKDDFIKMQRIRATQIQ